MTRLDPRPSREHEEFAAFGGEPFVAAPASAGPLYGRPAPYDREILWWLLLGLFALFVLGFYLMRLPGADEGNPLSWDRAMFGATSSVTLTGLRQDLSTSPFGGQTLIPVTLLVVTLGASFLTLVAAALPACRVLGMPHGPGRICAAAGVLVVGGTLVGALGLWNGSRSFPDALVQAASAVGNSGVFWGRLPRGDGWQVHAVLLPLSVVGGLGLPVLLDLFDRTTGRTPELLRHTKLVLTLAAAAYALGLVALLAFDDRFVSVLLGGVPRGGWTDADGLMLRSLAVDASVLSLDSRSAGFPLEPAGVAALPRAGQWVLTLLMAVGAGPAGTAGGLKLTTLYLLGKSAGGGTRGERQPPECGFAVAWLMLFAAVVAIGYAGLLWSAPQAPGERLLMMAVSAASNSGLAHDATALVRVPLMILALVMILGRVLPILLLWRMAARVDHAETVVG